jgi:cytochrome P450
MVVLGSPELAQEVLHPPAGNYLAGAANRRILPVLPEDTVLTLDGDAHRARRHQVAPMFHGERLDALTPAIRTLASREIERWPLGRPFAVLPRMRSLALRIATRLVLGIEDEAAVTQIERHLRSSLRPYSMLSGIETLHWLGPASPRAAAERCRRAFARGLQEAVGGRPVKRSDRGSTPVPLNADQVFALLLAGHETTATALAWAVDLLARAPDVAREVAREPRGSNRPWLDAVIWEALRLRPPLVDIVRQPAQPVRLAGSMIEAGALLLIPPPLIHLQATPGDADRFKPERFLSHRPDPHTWLPFGGGDRRCLGASLAMLELREIVPQIVERFVLKPERADGERVRLYGTALVPARGARVVLAARPGTGHAP